MGNIHLSLDVNPPSKRDYFIESPGKGIILSSFIWMKKSHPYFVGVSFYVHNATEELCSRTIHFPRGILMMISLLNLAVRSIFICIVLHLPWRVSVKPLSTIWMESRSAFFSTPYQWPRSPTPSVHYELWHNTHGLNCVALVWCITLYRWIPFISLSSLTLHMCTDHFIWVLNRLFPLETVVNERAEALLFYFNRYISIATFPVKKPVIIFHYTPFPTIFVNWS